MYYKKKVGRVPIGKLIHFVCLLFFECMHKKTMSSFKVNKDIKWHIINLIFI